MVYDKDGDDMYLISEVADLTGISIRTLRYYDEIGLLNPHHVNRSGYRMYNTDDLDRLQVILMYKHLGFQLSDIKDIISQKDYDVKQALKVQLVALEHKKEQLNQIISTLKKTISYYKGDENMSNEEKFIGIKKEHIKKNEALYGNEIRASHGDKVIDQSNQKYLNMSKEDFEYAQNLGEEILVKLKEALIENNPNAPLTQEICELHQTWIKYFWTDYTKEKHLGLCEMYLMDERFTAYYDAVGKGATKLLVDAMHIYLNK